MSIRLSLASHNQPKSEPFLGAGPSSNKPLFSAPVMGTAACYKRVRLLLSLAPQHRFEFGALEQWAQRTFIKRMTLLAKMMLAIPH
eukprot:1832095-Amphidinium_carterae.2